MTRSIWQGPFVDGDLLKKAERLKHPAVMNQSKHGPDVQQFYLISWD